MTTTIQPITRIVAVAVQVPVTCNWCESETHIDGVVITRDDRARVSLETGDYDRYRCTECGEMSFSPERDEYDGWERTALRLAHEQVHGVPMVCRTCNTIIDVMPPTDGASCVECGTPLTEYTR